MINAFKENSVNIRKANKMTDEELVGKLIVGEFVNNPRKELTENVCDLSVEQCGRSLAIKSAYLDSFDD